MGYLVDGALLAACIGAYRVYTDRRKSVLHDYWDSYKHLLVNTARHSGDFVASACFGAMCKYPTQTREFVDKATVIVSLREDSVERCRGAVLSRASRHYVWSNFGQLGYIQRVSKINPESSSLFDGKRAWKKNLVFTTPTYLNYVKDESIKDYLHLLSLVRDGIVGVLEATPAEVSDLVVKTQASKRDILQDIRKGHVLDRKPQSGVPILHALRMEIEGFLFGQSGPDPDRSTYIDKALADTSDGVVERMFPYVEVIVDTSGGSLISGKKDIASLCPNIPVYVPYLKLNERVVAVGKGDNEFVVCPVAKGLTIDGKSTLDKLDLQEGNTYSLSEEGSADSIQVRYVGKFGDAIRIAVA